VQAAPPLAPNAAMRWSIVKRMVKVLAPRSILEIGCGQGAFGARLAPLADYQAVEPDPTSFSVAQPRVTAAGGRIRNVGADRVSAADGPFDLVCAFEVLEHIDDDAGALTSWYRLVRPGGHLLLSMPAWPQRFNAWDTLVGHYRRYSPAHCRELLSATGFTQVTVVVFGWPLGFATENLRGRIAARRIATNVGAAAVTMQERTAGSGRLLQPRTLAGRAVNTLTLPFCALQRLRPGRGTGLVVSALRPPV
jgi:SAM-dependent methyltransferase